MDKSKRYSLTFWLWVLFAASVLVRFYFAIKTGVINTYHDEPWYWSISRALMHGEPLIYRGVTQIVKDIFYPMVLAPAHLFRDFDSAYHMMLLINVLLMSSAVFPAYLLARAVLGNPKWAFLIAIISMILPEMFYSAKLMQESIYYPYVMWMLWLFFVFLLKDKYSILRVALFSVLLCFAFYIKGIGNCMVLAFFSFYVIQIMFCGTFRQKLKSVILLAESVVVCLMTDHAITVLLGRNSDLSLGKTVMNQVVWVIYKLFGYTITSFHQLIFPSLVGIAALLLLATGIKYCEKKLRRYRWSSIAFQIGLVFLMAGAGIVLRHLGYFRPFSTYVIFSCIFFGIFPVVLPVVHAGKLSEKERDFLLFLLAFWLIPMTASCFSTLDILKEVSKESIRFHYRYFFYPAIGFFVLFLALCERTKGKDRIGISAIWSALGVLLLLIITPAGQGSMLDAIPLYGMQMFLTSAKGVIFLRILLIVYFLAGNFAFWKGHVKGFCTGIFFLLSCLYLISTRGVYLMHENQQQLLLGKNRDGERLAEYFADKEILEDASSILIVGDSWINSTETTEVHLDVPYRFCLWQDLTATDVLIDGEIQGGLLALYEGAYSWPYRLEGYSAPPYIVSLHPIALAGYEIEQIGLENYYLYVRSGA